ncbi:alpha/beta fold hydrolase [Nocardia tengchongensis]|uniref:alpha/beta fold hydrolase n=1 Tax=Nocardia tengchongensis TaxID=2055889 RepID=UPI003647CA68
MNRIDSGRVAPPVGGFQEVGGRRIFVNEFGSGGPAVVFRPGAGAVGLDYFGVQRDVAGFTTAVVYDRAGTGFSDAVELPRTAEDVATELRELLRRRRIEGPVVLAAHSLGGLYAHRFAQLFPQDVAGLVWLDGLHREWDEFVPPAAGLDAFERMTPDLAELREMTPAIRAEQVELLRDYPEDVRRSLLAGRFSDEWLRAGLAERGTLRPLVAELWQGPGVPDVPLIAVTVVGDGSRQRELDAAKVRMDAALARSVSRGEQRSVSGTFHHRLCFDRPDVVAGAIRDVVDLVGRP